MAGIGLIKRLIAQAIAAAGIGVVGDVPVGGVIDWWRATVATAVPANFAIADGSVVADAASPFNGQALPNLHQQMIRGISAAQIPGYGGDVGPPPTGGADTHDHTVDSHSHTVNNHSHTVNSHDHSLNNHMHAVGWHSHSISADGNHRHDSDVPDLTGSLRNDGQQHTTYAGSHSHSGATGSITVGNTGTNSGDTGTRSPGTSGSAPGTSSSAPGTDTINNVPAYVGMLKLIRIK